VISGQAVGYTLHYGYSVVVTVASGVATGYSPRSASGFATAIVSGEATGEAEETGMLLQYYHYLCI
jgi:hypothetical protein